MDQNDKTLNIHGPYLDLQGNIVILMLGETNHIFRVDHRIRNLKYEFRYLLMREPGGDYQKALAWLEAVPEESIHKLRDLARNA